MVSQLRDAVGNAYFILCVLSLRIRGHMNGVCFCWNLWGEAPRSVQAAVTLVVEWKLVRCFTEQWVGLYKLCSNSCILRNSAHCSFVRCLLFSIILTKLIFPVVILQHNTELYIILSCWDEKELARRENTCCAEAEEGCTSKTSLKKAGSCRSVTARISFLSLSLYS